MSIVSLIILTYIAYKTLEFTAKPNLSYKLLNRHFPLSKKLKLSLRYKILVRFEYLFTKTCFLTHDNKTKLVFSLTNSGHWFAKPAIVIKEMYLNFDNQFELENLKYGSALERRKTRKSVRLGKKCKNELNCKYFQISDIHLFHNEPGEEVHIRISAPLKQGIYHSWISSIANDTSMPPKYFRFRVL